MGSNNSAPAPPPAGFQGLTTTPFAPIPAPPAGCGGMATADQAQWTVDEDILWASMTV